MKFQCCVTGSCHGLYPEPDDTFQPVSEWFILTLPKLYLISRFLTEICIDFSSIPSCYILCTFHPPAYNHLHNIWEPMINFLSTTSHFFFCLGYKYCSRHFAFKHLHTMQETHLSFSWNYRIWQVPVEIYDTIPERPCCWSWSVASAVLLMTSPSVCII